MSGTIGISCQTQNNKQNKNLYFKAIDVLETTYSSVKLSYLTNLDKSVNNVNVKTLKEPQPKFTYTAGPFYVTCKSDTNFEYRNNTLIINEECTEIEISNKDITTPAECSISINNPSVKIILNGVNIKNTLKRDAIYASQYRKTIDINLHIKENTTNTIESINTGINLEDTSGGAITGNFLISGDNNDNAKLEIKGNNNYNAILSTAANIKISGGNISIKKVDTDKDLIITGGKTLFKTNTSGLGSYSWSVGGNITIDNAVAVFEAMEPFGKYSLDNTKSSSNITIGKSAVVITPTVSTFNELKTKKKGFLIKADQFKSIDDLKIFSINNKTGEIIINNDLTIESDYMGSNDLSCPNGQIIINEGTKVIANNLYLQDQQGQTKAPNVDSAGSKLINNGELTILPGKTLYAKALYNATHENNGTIYNLGEIIGKESLVGKGRIVELELTAEVNGELYNDITVDKVNRTVTINNLTPETDYDINLIASLEPYIERSKVIKKRTLEAPHATLMVGSRFRRTLEQMSGFANVTEIHFVKEKAGAGINVAIEGEINASINGSILKVASESNIFANKNCDSMFYDFGYIRGYNSINKIVFDNFDTSKVIDMDYMFYRCNKITGEMTIKNSNILTHENMFLGTSEESSGNFVLNYTNQESKKMAEAIIKSSDNSFIVLGTMV